MRIPLLILLMIAFSACHFHYHTASSDKRIITEHSQFYRNDSIRVGMMFPADIDIYTSGHNNGSPVFPVKIPLRKSQVGAVLFQGQTTQAPHYSFTVFYDEQKSFKEIKQETLPDTIIIIDSIFGGQKILIAGIAFQSSLRNMRADLTKSLNSIKYGKQYEAKVPENPFAIIKDEIFKDQAHKYLKPYLELKRKAGNYKTESENSRYFQAMLTMSGMIANAPEFDNLENRYESKRQLDLSDFNDKLLATEIFIDNQAIEKLTYLTKKHQVVMINELHWDRRHRKQFIDLLPVFKNAGFTYLGMEAFNNDAFDLNKFDYPVDTTGFYTNEPMMAQIIRVAKSLGFHIFKYENFDPEIDREVGQAKNIYRQTIAKDANAKVLVYAGIGHIHEKLKTERPRMAARFKELYSIDPLTIDQHILGMNTHLFPDQSLILLQPEKLAVQLPVNMDVDYYLGSKKNIAKHVHSEDLKATKIDSIDVDSVFMQENLSSLLYNENEFVQAGFHAIPLYVHIGLQKDYQLKKGNYTWILTDNFGEIIAEKTLQID